MTRTDHRRAGHERPTAAQRPRERIIDADAEPALLTPGPFAGSPTAQRYRHNLAALSALQPDVAKAVDAAPIPDGVVAAAGRDGRQTFQCPGQDGRLVWFGGSSMPGVSAPELLAGFKSDGRSVALPGVFTGLEPIVVASRMPAHNAVFVLEPDPLAVKLAMHLYDYTDLLTAGRIVFILGEGTALIDAMSAFFDRFGGYELPAHLLQSPQRTATRIAELQALLERAGQVILERQARAIESLSQALRARAFDALPSAPRVAILSVDPRPIALEQARRIQRGLTRLNWQHVLCLPDAPGKCHTLARLQTVNNVRAQLVVFVNGSAGLMETLLPQDLPVVSWFLPGSTVEDVPPSPPPGHLIFACSTKMRQVLLDGGFQSDLINVCEPAADDTVFCPTPLGPEQRDELDLEVAVLLDLPDDRPEACDISLASHVTLLGALRDSAKRLIDADRWPAAESLLDRTLSALDMDLQDAGTRATFLGLIRSRIAPAAVARRSVETLMEQGHRMAVWGHNWEDVEGTDKIKRGPIPVGTPLNRIFNAARVIVFPGWSDLVLQTALDALAAGAHVVCRAPDEAFSRTYSTLGDIEPHLHFYRTRTELVERTQALVAVGRTKSAPTLIGGRHTTAERILSIRNAVQRTHATAPQSV